MNLKPNVGAEMWPKTFTFNMLFLAPDLILFCQISPLSSKYLITYFYRLDYGVWSLTGATLDFLKEINFENFFFF